MNSDELSKLVHMVILGSHQNDAVEYFNAMGKVHALLSVKSRLLEWVQNYLIFSCY